MILERANLPAYRLVCQYENQDYESVQIFLRFNTLEFTDLINGLEGRRKVALLSDTIDGIIIQGTTGSQNAQVSTIEFEVDFYATFDNPASSVPEIIYKPILNQDELVSLLKYCQLEFMCASDAHEFLHDQIREYIGFHGDKSERLDYDEEHIN